MSLDIAKIDAISLLAMKLEATTGTEEVLTATEAGFIVYNFEINRDENNNDRETMAGKGQNPSVPGVTSGTASFEIELAGSGTAATSPPWALAVLPACDMEEDTGVWTFSTSSTGQTLTVAKYEDGAKRVLYGAAGTFVITKENGKPGRMKVDLKGKYKESADTSILAPTFPAVKPPVDALTFTLGGVTPVISKWEVDAGNEVIVRQHSAASDGTGLLGGAIVQRKPVGSIDPEQKAKTTQDWNNLIDAGTQNTLAVVLGTVAGNTIAIDSTTCQVVKAARANRDKLITRDVGLLFTGTSPFSITFT